MYDRNGVLHELLRRILFSCSLSFRRRSVSYPSSIRVLLPCERSRR